MRQITLRAACFLIVLGVVYLACLSGPDLEDVATDVADVFGKSVLAQGNGNVLYKTGWEYGSVGRSGVTDSGNPYGDMVEIGNTDQYGLGYVQTENCFDGSQCLRIDWEKHGEGEVDGACEWYVATPAVMGSVHDYYVGWAIRFPTNWETPGGRKLLYRNGGAEAAESVLFQGTKGFSCGQTSSNAQIYFKNPGNIGGGTNDDAWNQYDGEKQGVGGPMCETYGGDSCIPWPGCSETTGNFIASDNEWHTLIYYVKEHATEGVHTLWIDGVKVLHIDKDAWDDTAGRSSGPCVQSYYNSAHLDFSGFKFPTYFNFGPPNHDQSEYWDNFVVAASFEAVADYLGISANDTTPPTHFNPQPQGNLSSGTTQTAISLETNEQATCRYSTTPGTEYPSMPNTFQNTGSTQHSTLVTGLQDGQAYSYYVRCNDTSGNYNTDDFNITFGIEQATECPDETCDPGECSSCPGDCSLIECCGIEGCNPSVGEDCGSCYDDCPCTGSQLCCSGVCTIPDCSSPQDCGTDSCTDYTCSDPGTCSASCSSQDITSCINDDGCCPPDCTNITDSDCPEGEVTETWGETPDSDHSGTIEDAFINIDYNNYEGQENIKTWSWSTPSPHRVANTIIIKADLSAIPQSATITNATLYLYQTDYRGLGQYTNTIHKLINHNPVISEVTGYNASSAEQWSPVPPGTTHNDAPLGLADISQAEDTVILDTSNGYKTFSITQMVQDWVSSPSTNYGLLISGEDGTSSETGRTFASTEHSDANLRPKFVITYSLEQHHRADTNPQDGCIEQHEMMWFIEQWKYNSTEYPMWEMMGAVSLWKSGTGC